MRENGSFQLSNDNGYNYLKQWYLYLFLFLYCVSLLPKDFGTFLKSVSYYFEIIVISIVTVKRKQKPDIY